MSKAKGAFDWTTDKVDDKIKHGDPVLDDTFSNVFKENKILMDWLNAVFNKATYNPDHGVMCYLEGQRDLARSIKAAMARSEKRRKSQ